MPYIFKPSRYLLNKKLFQYNKYVKGKVLDIGSGSKNYKHLFNNYHQYLTLEIDDKFKPDILASAYKIPLENNSIDTVICTQVLEHLIDPQKALNEFYRVLKRGGYGIISAPFFNELHEEPIDYFRYTKYALKVICEKAGFKVIKTERTSGFFSVIAQLEIRYIRNRFIKYKWFLSILSLLIKIYGRFMILLDKIDKSEINKKFTIDWSLVIKKY